MAHRSRLCRRSQTRDKRVYQEPPRSDVSRLLQSIFNRMSRELRVTHSARYLVERGTLETNLACAGENVRTKGRSEQAVTSLCFHPFATTLRSAYSDATTCTTAGRSQRPRETCILAQAPHGNLQCKVWAVWLLGSIDFSSLFLVETDRLLPGKRHAKSSGSIYNDEECLLSSLRLALWTYPSFLAFKSRP